MIFKDISYIDEELKLRKHQYISVSDEKIVFIGDEKRYKGEIARGKLDPDDEVILEGSRFILSPAFYNAHGHSPMTLMRGYGENMQLQDWLEKRIFPFEEKLNGERIYWATLLAMAESAQQGIVSTTDMYYFLPDMAKAVAESGLKMNMSRALVNFDSSDPYKMESYDDMQKAYEEIHGLESSKILVDCSIHGEYTSDPKTVSAVAEFSRRHGLRNHIHLSETKSEHEECIKRHGKSPARYFYDLGMFDSPTTAAHCVHVTEEDMKLLKEKGVFVATNPCSNMKLASGICDVAKMLDMGIKIAIGTDSVASNNSLNFFEEMKVLALSARIKSGRADCLSPEDIFKMATRGGALSQGRDDCGLIKEGNKADIIAIDSHDVSLHPVHNIINNLVYSGNGKVHMTMCDGKVIYKDGRHTTMNICHIIENCDRIVDEILRELS